MMLIARLSAVSLGNALSVASAERRSAVSREGSTGSCLNSWKSARAAPAMRTAAMTKRIRIGGAVLSAPPLTNSLGDLLRRESKLLGDLLVGRRGAEAIDADHQRVVIEVLVPTP